MSWKLILAGLCATSALSVVQADDTHTSTNETAIAAQESSSSEAAKVEEEKNSDNKSNCGCPKR